jgi:hypothetical protein
MFEKCSKVDKACGFCGISTYNPTTFSYDDVEKEFCGIAGGYDSRVSLLPDCWLRMAKGQRSSFVKKKKEEHQALLIRNKT